MISAHHKISVSGGCDHLALCVYASPTATNDPGVKTHRGLMLLIKRHAPDFTNQYDQLQTTQACVWVLLTAIHEKNKYLQQMTDTQRTFKPD